MAQTPKPKNPNNSSQDEGKPAQAKRQSPEIPGAFRLLAGSLEFLTRNWKVFLGIVLVYGILNAVLIQGFGVAANLGEMKSIFDRFLSGGWGELLGGFTIFTYLIGSSGASPTSTAGVYQVILTVVVSLAIIWTLRQLYAGHKVRVRDGFYRGMTPLVQFVLVLLVLVAQLLPLAIGAFLYSTVTISGLAATIVEQIIWAMIALGLASATMYMLSSSLFAAYIVTLPDMTPLAALRSASQLVRGRRWTVLRKILFLPMALVLLAALLIIPLIIFATPWAVWAFSVLTILALPVALSYMYSLYRSML